MVPLKLIQYCKSIIYQQQVNKQLNNKVLILKPRTSQICLIDRTDMQIFLQSSFSFALSNITADAF